jgi:hypothetical protein
MDAPNVEAPKGCSWLGEWYASHEWSTEMADDYPGDPIWIREALEHDGHEECCRHRHYVILDRVE